MALLRNSEAETASKLASLRRISWAARQVVGGNVDGRKLSAENLGRLRSSLARQRASLQELYDMLPDGPENMELRTEAYELGQYLDAALKAVAAQLNEA